MARIRSIKPDAFTSESLSSVPVGARWTFAGLWTYTDDEGRGRGDVRLIKSALYPLDDAHTVESIEEHLCELERIGAVCRYDVEGRHYLHVPKFATHQRVNRKTDSLLPECRRPVHDSFSEASVSDPGASTEVVHREVEVEQGSGKGNGSGKSIAFRADVESLCEHLADKIESNGSHRPTITSRWRDSCRLMLDKDARTEEQIRGAIDWSQADEFWRANILSMPTLREKYDQLRLAASRGRRNGAQADTDDLFDRAAARMVAREATS